MEALFGLPVVVTEDSATWPPYEINFSDWSTWVKFKFVLEPEEEE